MNDSKPGVTKAITVRIPESQYRQLKEYAAAQKTSLNWVVSEAIAHYGSRLRRLSVVEDILHYQSDLRSNTGCSQSEGREVLNSVEDLREIRESRSRDVSDRDWGSRS